VSLPFIGIFISSANALLAPRTTNAMSASRDDILTSHDFEAPVWARDWASEASSDSAAVAKKSTCLGAVIVALAIGSPLGMRKGFRFVGAVDIRVAEG
jgi:hypothetical protein